MITKTVEYRCPVCNSSRLIKRKDGDGGHQALVDGLLSGVDTFVTDEIGNENIEVTCLSCGNEFKLEAGTQVEVLKNAKDGVSENAQSASRSNEVDEIILGLCRQGKKIEAIKFFKEQSGLGLKEAKDYIDNIAANNGIESKGACFVATACYGDYDAPEVLILRVFRDKKLLKTFSGRVFVKVYYFVSPFFANMIAKSDMLKTFVKKFVLKPMIKKIEN